MGFFPQLLQDTVCVLEVLKNPPRRITMGEAILETGTPDSSHTVFTALKEWTYSYGYIMKGCPQLTRFSPFNLSHYQF